MLSFRIAMFAGTTKHTKQLNHQKCLHFFKRAFQVEGNPRLHQAKTMTLHHTDWVTRTKNVLHSVRHPSFQPWLDEGPVASQKKGGSSKWRHLPLAKINNHPKPITTIQTGLIDCTTNSWGSFGSAVHVNLSAIWCNLAAFLPVSSPIDPGNERRSLWEVSTVTQVEKC